MSARRNHVKLSFNSAAANADWSPGAPGEPFSVSFDAPIVLSPNKSYGVRVLSIAFERSFPNITATNNTFVYTKSGVTRTLTVPDGLYTYEDIQNSLNDQSALLGDGTLALPVWSLVGNPATGLLAVIINSGHTGYSVQWDVSTIGPMMGYPDDAPILAENATAPQVQWGPALADAAQGVDALCVQCSLIRGSYRNGVSGNTLEVIPLAGDVPVNGYYVHYPRQQTWSPLVDSTISYAEFRMVDGLGRALTNRGLSWSVDIAIDELS